MTEKVNGEEVQEIVLSQNEITALEQGWKPKEEWEGEEADWRPAKEFVERGQLFKKIDDQKHQVADLKRTVDALKQHNDRIFDLSYKKAVAELKDQKKAAIADEDIALLAEIDEKLETVKEDFEAEKQVRQQAPANTEPDPRFTTWLDTNAWYAQNAEMHDFADGLAAAYIARTGDRDLGNVLKAVESKVKLAFPESFSNTRKAQASKVEGVTPTRGKTDTKVRKSDLDEGTRKIMDTLVRSGAITEEKYLADYTKAV